MAVTDDKALTLKEIAYIRNHYSETGGSFDHTWSIPTERIVFEVKFQENDPPTDINYDILLGNTKVDHKYCEVQKTENSIIINFSEHLDRTKLVVNWTW